MGCFPTFKASARLSRENNSFYEQSISLLSAWARWTKLLIEIFRVGFFGGFFFWSCKKMLNSLGLRWENTLLKGFSGNCFCNRARENLSALWLQKEMTIGVTAEGNLLSKPWLFSQKLSSSGRVPEASPRKGFLFWAWFDLSRQIPSVTGLLWRRESGV